MVRERDQHLGSRRRGDHGHVIGRTGRKDPDLAWSAIGEPAHFASHVRLIGEPHAERDRGQRFVAAGAQHATRMLEAAEQLIVLRGEADHAAKRRHESTEALVSRPVPAPGS